MMQKVNEKDVVRVHYTGRYENGKVFDSSANGDPLKFKVGGNMVIPGFEEAVTGMQLNESKKVNIPFAKAYGPVRKELQLEISKKNMPNNLNLKVGKELVSKQPDGNEMTFKVIEISESTITVDGNHPLAGENLIFEIRLLEIL